jgi:hypothetical protein
MVKKRKVKSRVSIEITDNKLLNLDTPVSDDSIQKQIKKASKIVKANAVLISRLNYPEYVTYDGDILVVSPRAKLKINKDLLEGKIPEGVLVKLVK